ncbi:mediator of RNA polymerase II transcription subunit 15-like isoform X2 [Teleopsis dalmanni]|uniref:mediator of RNA polymerase II transcription subunit 15-like isoform X2 n=1 Tax=Teleopsis dalmanni TaxID=139649 RepID=UPI0018CE31BB|nr:mediator of RNA polymerase II transcription subunit 15-like isoform X2 [Teleopsis dalmanni]XP_037947386.1 mediator of RNA polymerase II transcription subunit 15-like isoform X2 [Teleopsis dalmanni]
MDRVTKPQKKMLITLLRETKYMEGKKEKEWYWEKIQSALNTIGPKKTIIQWKKCWRDMRLTTRKKLAELKRCQLAGGSPPPGIELNQEDNDIIDIVGTEYFYEEMNGELKPETFMSNFDYVPEHFCDAILTAAANGQHQHMQHPKEQQHAAQQQQDHHTNDGETNDAAGSSNHTDTHGNSFQNSGLGQLQTHNGDHNTGAGTSQQHSNLPQHPAFHGGLHPHLLRRQQHTTTPIQRETVFEEKLLQLIQEAFPKKSKKRKSRDPDKLFLLSLYDEFKRVPEEIRLDVKAELIQVLKKYQKKMPIKQEKTNSQSSTSTSVKQSPTPTSDKIQLPHNSQLSHGMYQLQKKYDKNEKEQSPQSQIERVQHGRDAAGATTTVAIHPSQQIPHSLFQLQKKYEENNEKVHQQSDQRKHVEATHQQHTAHQQPPPPPSNEQHLHHTQMPHGIMFPLTQIRNEQSATQQHHSHNPHQQPQQHPHQQTQHHAPQIFGTSTAPTSMSTDRPSMAYENVG